MGSVATPIIVCPAGISDGTPFTTSPTWLGPCQAPVLALPTANMIVAGKIGAKGWANIWTLASELQPTDQVYAGASGSGKWVNVNTIVIAPTPVVVPPPPPVITPPVVPPVVTPPAPTSVVTLAAGQ